MSSRYIRAVKKPRLVRHCGDWLCMGMRNHWFFWHRLVVRYGATPGEAYEKWFTGKR